jgi:hypothetical protein
VGTDWIEYDRFGPIFTKTIIFTLKTGSINSGTGFPQFCKTVTRSLTTSYFLSNVTMTVFVLVACSVNCKMATCTIHAESTLRYPICFNNQTDQEDKTEGGRMRIEFSLFKPNLKNM